MTRKEITIQLPHGLEARPVAMLVQVASQCESEIHVESAGRNVNAKSIMGVMALASQNAPQLQVTADGEDEAEAVHAIVELIS